MSMSRFLVPAHLSELPRQYDAVFDKSRDATR